jgi:hypothetical protein
LYFKFLEVSSNMKFKLQPPDNWLIIPPNKGIENSATYTCGGENNPCGRYILKAIVSYRKIDGIETILQLNTENYSSRGNNADVLFKYFNNSMLGTRSINSTDPKVEVINYYYEIQTLK